MVAMTASTRALYETMLELDLETYEAERAMLKIRKAFAHDPTDMAERAHRIAEVEYMMAYQRAQFSNTAFRKAFWEE